MKTMDDEIKISSNRATELTLRAFLKREHYPPILEHIEKHLGAEIRSDQSGNAYERCIDWCAQHGGRYDDVKTIVLQLYQKFYFDLPENTQSSFDEMAAEVGFDTSKARVEERGLVARVRGMATGFRKILR